MNENMIDDILEILAATKDGEAVISKLVNTLRGTFTHNRIRVGKKIGRWSLPTKGTFEAQLREVGFTVAHHRSKDGQTITKTTVSL